MTDKKISIKWIEAILLIVILLAGLGIGTLASSLIESEREIMRPREEAYIRNAQLPLRQSELSISQAELSTLRSKIMDQQVEWVKQSAKLESLKVGYPALNTIKDLAADTSLKPEVKMAFTQTQFDLDSTQRTLNDLNARLPAATETAVQKAIDLSAAQESVHRDFERAQRRFQVRTRVLMFFTSIVLSIAVLVLADLFISYLNRKEQFGIRPKFVLPSGFAILLALTSYQVLQLAGATLMIIVLASVASLLALQRVKEGI